MSPRILRAGALLLAALALPLLGKGKPKVPWLESAKEAVEASRKGKRPLAVLLVQEGSSLSKRMEEGIEGDPRLAEVLDELVWLRIVAGSSDYQRWFEPECGGLVEGAPSLAILSPKGASDPAFIGLPSASSPEGDDIYPILRAALARAGKKAPAASAERARSLLASAKEAAIPAEELRLRAEALRLADGWPDLEAQAEAARKGIETLLQKGNAEMLQAQQELRSPEKALGAYQEIQRRYAGSSVADWAAQEIRRLEKK